MADGAVPDFKSSISQPSKKSGSRLSGINKSQGAVNQVVSEIN
jgi:hypothetical protein